MHLITKSIKISGSSDVSHWGGSFSENGLFVLLETQGSTDESAQDKGKEILDLVLTKITNYKERNLAVIKELVDWAKEIKAIQTLTVGFLQENVLYLANLGAGEVLLFRDGKTGKILSSGETSSGKLTEGDTILFASKTFLDCIDNGKQQEFLREENLTTAAEEASTILIGNPNSNGATALLVKLEISKDSNALSIPISAVSRSKYIDIIKDKWLNFTSLFRQKEDDFRENAEEEKSKKTLLTIAVILILLLIVSIFFNINHSQSTSKKTLFDQTVSLVSHQYDEAVSLIDLNPGRARSLLADSKLSLSQILAGFPKKSNEYKAINEWLSKIAEQEVAAYKIYKFTSVPLFFDINLIKNGGTGSKMSIHKDTAVILDTKNKTVYSLSLDNKQAGIIAGSEVVKDAQTVAVHGKSAYILNSDGITQIDIPTKVSQMVVKADKNWGEIKELVAFAGNLYLLDRQNNAVWKYIAQEAGFSTRANYLNPDVKVPLGKAGKMVIDGSVWVTIDQDTILKFTNGRGDPFTFKGLADTISGISTIFTSDEDKSLYVLDKHSQRILLFDKDGNYQSQYQWEELKNADDMAVSEEQKKIFVLSAGKIYSLDLK